MGLTRTLTVASLLVLAGCRASLTAKAKEFQALRRAHRVEAAMEMLAPDPRIWFEERIGAGQPWTITGGKWSYWDEHFRGESKYRDWSEAGTSVSAVAWEINDYYRLLERGRQPVRLTWYFDATGRIEGYLVSSRGLPRNEGRRAEFEAWARANRPEELEYLEPGGAIDPTGDRPERYRALLNDWRRSVGAEPVL